MSRSAAWCGTARADTAPARAVWSCRAPRRWSPALQQRARHRNTHSSVQTTRIDGPVDTSADRTDAPGLAGFQGSWRDGLVCQLGRAAPAAGHALHRARIDVLRQAVEQCGDRGLRAQGQGGRSRFCGAGRKSQGNRSRTSTRTNCLPAARSCVSTFRGRVNGVCVMRSPTRPSHGPSTG